MAKSWKETILMLGITIVLPLFIGTAIDTFLEGEEYSEEYSRNLFLIASIAGIASILIAVHGIKIEGVSAGLIAGGIITSIYGLMRYWEHAESLLRVIFLGILLSLLLWIGIKKLSIPEKTTNK